MTSGTAAKFDSSRDYWAIEVSDGDGFQAELWDEVTGPLPDGPATVRHFHLPIYSSEELAAEAARKKCAHYHSAGPRRISGQEILNHLGKYGSLWIDDKPCDLAKL